MNEARKEQLADIARQLVEAHNKNPIIPNHNAIVNAIKHQGLMDMTSKGLDVDDAAYILSLMDFTVKVTAHYKSD